MNLLRIVVVKISGGSFKAILPDGQETIIGRDEKELLGRLKRRGISDPIEFPHCRRPI
jgi:hypothetical protein